MARVHHKVPHCTGRWQPHGEYAWRCTPCGAVTENSAATLRVITRIITWPPVLHGAPEEAGEDDHGAKGEAGQ